MAGRAAGAGSFATGFGKALVSVMLADRERRRAKKDKDEENRLRADLATLPTLINLAESSNDWRLVEETIGRVNPDIAKQFKKTGSPFQAIAPMLSSVQDRAAGKEGPAAGQPPAAAGDVTAGGVDAWTQPGGVDPYSPAATSAAPALLASRPAVAPNTQQRLTGPPAPGSSLFGTQMLTPEEKLVRQVDTRRGVASRVGLSPQESIYYALDYKPSNVAGTPPQVGTFGDWVKRREAGLGRPLNDVELRAEMVEWERQQAEANRGYGVDREAIARAMYGKSYGELGSVQQAAVIDQEQQQLTREAAARGTGTAQARFSNPMTVEQAQAAGVPQGTSQADVAGQTTVPTDLRERRRSMEVLKQDLGRVQELIEILPSERELSGNMPGAVLAVRRRMNSDSGLKDDQGNPMSNRVAIARLQSVVDSIVNVLARTRGEQRGTQTERDAERAYNAVVQLQAGLTDPFGGDTRESAAARLTEALDGLERVLAALPAGAVPTGNAGQQGGLPGAVPPAGTGAGASTPGTAGAPAAAPTSTTPTSAAPAASATPTSPVLPGAVMVDGVLYIDGKPID